MTSEQSRNAASFAAALALLVLFAIQSRSAALTKSATWDEPLHAAAGWSYLHAGDWRANLEHPPLTKLWSAVLSEPLDLAASTKTMSWRAILADPLRWQWHWAVAAVFHSPAVEGDAFIQRARLPMLAFGLALGALIAIWAWRVGGPAAALPALALFVFSPDFIGHASLVTNDVPLAFAWMALAFAGWNLGERISMARIVIFGAAVACATLVKFSGLLGIPLAAGLLGFRALQNRPWPAGRTELARLVARVAAACVIMFEVVVLCWVLTWCVYGIRLSAVSDEHPLDFVMIRDRIAGTKLGTTDPSQSPPTADEIASFRHDALARFALFSQRKGLLPEAWNWGILAHEADATTRPAFLLSTVSKDGWWYYFPVALLFKEPVAATLSVLAALTLGIRWLRSGEVKPSKHAWLLVCMVAPPGVYAVVAMGSRLNIGVRLFFPVLPFLYVATGIVAARAMRRWDRRGRLAVAALAVILAIECLAVWPNYIAHVNVLAGGSRCGLQLLGDSNLDWGQDLKLLATWHAANPREKLYLCYHGTADPASYGIRYVNALGCYPFGPPSGALTEPGVLAMSASNLQGISASPRIQPILSALRRSKPIDVLGGSIYLYRFPVPP